MELPLQHLVTGRRIYVHEHSFKLLADGGSNEIAAVSMLLRESWIFRVALHHIGSDTLIGAISKHDETLIVDALHDRYRVTCTPILGAMAAITPMGQAPLLDHHESLHATCFDSGYYTFATDNASACRMYDDTLPLRGLYSACAMGNADPDLTMVRGRRLVWAAPVPNALPAPSTRPPGMPGAVEDRVDLAVESGQRLADRRLARLFE